MHRQEWSIAFTSRRRGDGSQYKYTRGTPGGPMKEGARSANFPSGMRSVIAALQRDQFALFAREQRWPRRQTFSYSPRLVYHKWAAPGPSPDRAPPPPMKGFSPSRRWDTPADLPADLGLCWQSSRLVRRQQGQRMPRGSIRPPSNSSRAAFGQSWPSTATNAIPRQTPRRWASLNSTPPPPC